MPGIKDAKCVLVIGATAGLGRALALAIHDLDTQPTVVVVGRRQERLDELAKRSNRIKTFKTDINTTEENLRTFVRDVLSQYPQLDAVVFMSGVQHIYDLTKPESVDLSLVDEEINTNYISITKLIVLFLPHFLKLSNAGRHSFIIPVTSSLSVVPKANVLNYCASKAALRSFDTSLRLQLADTKVNVMEIVPPLVESELHDHQGTTPMLSKFWMPLDKFTELAMEGLIRGDSDIAVGDAVDVLNKFEKGKAEVAARMHMGNSVLKLKQ